MPNNIEVNAAYRRIYDNARRLQRTFPDNKDMVEALNEILADAGKCEAWFDNRNAMADNFKADRNKWRKKFKARAARTSAAG